MRRSIIWRLPSSKFRALVQSCNNYGQILSYFGLKNVGGNNTTIKKRIKEEGIDDSHIHEWLRTKQYKLSWTIPLLKILVRDSTYTNRTSLKRRLISNNLLKDICEKCGLPSVWNGEKLILVLDHINGIRNDNRIENLRLLCPNCNSQTSTFCGRTRKKSYNCKKCGKVLKGEGKTGLCLSCAPKKSNTRPKKFEVSKIKLQKLVKEKTLTQIALEFGVSDSAIRKRCKLLGVSTPGLGYWNKVYACSSLPPQPF